MFPYRPAAIKAVTKAMMLPAVVRHLVNILQAIQLIFNVGVIIIQNGQGLYQINGNICYIVVRDPEQAFIAYTTASSTPD